MAYKSKEHAYKMHRRWALKHKRKMRVYCNAWKKRNKEKVEIARLRKVKERREHINRIKMRPCMDCGIQYNPWVMQFDHRDPSQKKISIGQEVGYYSHLRILEEIKKCDIICANCHFERTHNRKINQGHAGNLQPA